MKWLKQKAQQQTDAQEEKTSVAPSASSVWCLVESDKLWIRQISFFHSHDL